MNSSKVKKTEQNQFHYSSDMLQISYYNLRCYYVLKAAAYF